MGRGCGCSGSSCGCKVEAGTGIAVTGVGSSSAPYVITNTAGTLAESFGVTDTPSLNLTLAGAGTPLNPFNLSGVVTLALTSLSDVNDPEGAPVAGETLIWVGSGGGAHWEFQRQFRSFTTAGRSTAASAGAGGTYYDTTLGKPAWSTGAVWKDAAGTTI